MCSAASVDLLLCVCVCVCVCVCACVYKSVYASLNMHYLPHYSWSPTTANGNSSPSALTRCGCECNVGKLVCECVHR